MGLGCPYEHAAQLVSAEEDPGWHSPSALQAVPVGHAVALGPVQVTIISQPVLPLHLVTTAPFVVAAKQKSAVVKILGRMLAVLTALQPLTRLTVGLRSLLHAPKKLDEIVIVALTVTGA